MASPAANAPFPGSPSPRVGNLPLALTPLVGREDDIAAVGTLVRRTGMRLLTLVGPGGVGKTRLAMEVARQANSDDFDQVGVASLAAIQNPALVPQAIAHALSVPADSDQTVLGRIQEGIAGRRVLLVLDNMEHLPAAGPMVVDLLANCPGMTVLGTSRARLNVSGERLYPVHPLGTPAAVSLFVQRAEAVAPDFHLNTTTQPMIEAICLRIDGLPLAIELAAARLTVLSLPELLARLAHPLPLLTGGPRDAPDRHRTMRDVIAWSYDLLSEDTRTVFWRLGVFVGGFTIDAAESVAGIVPILPHLETLVTSSLITRIADVGGVPRFAMLETIRQFALEQLIASNHESEIRSRHARHFATAIDAELPYQDGPDQRATHDRIEAELQNCRAALTWALDNEAAEVGILLAGALWRTWCYGASFGTKPFLERLAEGRSWLDRMLAMRDGLPLPLLTEALAGASRLSGVSGDWDAARAWAEELQERARAEPVPYATFWAGILLGILEMQRGNHDAAAAMFQQAVDAAPEIRNPESALTQALKGLSAAEDRRGNHQEALAQARRAVLMGRASGNPGETAAAAHHYALLQRARGNWPETIRGLREALGLETNLRSGDATSFLLVHLALAAIDAGYPAEAVVFLARADPLGDDHRYRPDQDAAIRRSRERLGEPAFSAAWDRGTALGWEAVLAEAASLADKIEAERRGAAKAPTAGHDGERFGLTRRELEVLRLLAEGRSNRAIAEELSLSERTVEHHLLHTYTKLGLESRAAAVAFALRHGLA
jgi:predicted ATPase/DNA-binding CsgD family transcriptional regulator